MTENVESICVMCVYHPPNLPRHAYADQDWADLQHKQCAYDCQPGDAQCRGWRKTSCSLVDLQQLTAQGR